MSTYVPNLPPFAPVRRPAPRWLVLSTVVACLGVGAAGGWLASRGQAQRAQHLGQRRGVAACDAGWGVCRIASGHPVADAHGCRWVQVDHYDEYTFVAPDGKSGWRSCAWSPEPDEEAAEDQSTCGAAYRQCFGIVTAQPETGLKSSR